MIEDIRSEIDQLVVKIHGQEKRMDDLERSAREFLGKLNGVRDMVKDQLKRIDALKRAINSFISIKIGEI